MKSLVSFLNERSPLELRHIAESWQATLTDRLYAGNTYQLSQEMQSEYLQRRQIEKLTPDQVTFLQKLIQQPQASAAVIDLETVFSPIADLTGISGKLREAGILYEDRVRAEPSEPGAIIPVERKRSGWSALYGARRSAPSPPVYKAVLIVPRELARPFERLLAERTGTLPGGRPLYRQPLPQLLARLEPELLEVLAETWGILAVSGNIEPAHLSGELARVLSDRAAQQRIMSGLPEESLALFSRLRALKKTTLPALLDEYVSIKRLGRSLRPLTERLLAWEAFENGQSVVFIPPEISQPLGELLPGGQPMQTVTPPADATPQPPYALAWDALTLLNYLSQNQVVLTTKSYIPKRDLKKLNSQLWRPETESETNPSRLSFLVSLCFYHKLYFNDPEAQQLITGPELENWLRLDLYEQLRRFCASWLQEGGRLSPVYYPYYYGMGKAINTANRSMLNWLAQCTPGTWYALSDLQHKIQREDPYFILPRRDMLNILGSQRVAELGKIWMRVEGELIQQTFNSALEWLGLVQVGRDTTGRVTAFSLTAFGAEMCGQPGAARQVGPATDKPLVVQPNFEIVLFAPQVETIWTLSKFTSLKKLDQVSIYSLDRSSVLRGLESGLVPGQMVEWLEARNPQPLPQNLVTSIQDWSKGFHRVKVGPVTLVEVEDPAVLDELLVNKQYAEYFERRLSPTAALVRLPETTTNRRTDPLKSFKSRLRAGGFYAD